MLPYRLLISVTTDLRFAGLLFAFSRLLSLAFMNKSALAPPRATPPSTMAKGSSSQQQQQNQNLGADVLQLLEQLERHCLAPDGSYVSKSAHNDLLLAREEMARERTRYLEAMAIYGEVTAVLEEYQQVLSGSNLGGAADVYAQSGQMTSQVYETLEHRFTVAEAAQRLRLPLLSKDGDIHEDEIEKLGGISRSSMDNTTTSFTVNSSSNSFGYSNSVAPSTVTSFNTSDLDEPGVGGLPNYFLGITPTYLWQAQRKQSTMAMDNADYNRTLACELESRLEIKCDKLADSLQLDVTDLSAISQIPSARLPERVKLFIEEIEKQETALLEDLYSMDRKFAEHYNVLEQILGVLIKFVKDLKLDHQHQYDELRKDWLCKRCQTMNAKLRVLELILLRDTYTKDSVPALHRVRKYLLEATEEASIAYNKAVTRLREYQGVDPHFDTIARQYHDIAKKLEGLQWTIHQVELDLKRALEHSIS